MKTPGKKRRGLAIISTLLILSLLLALIAAFLTVNRAGNQFTLSSAERAKAQDVCLAAMHYAWFNLELKRNWGDTLPVEGEQIFPYGSPKLKMECVQGNKLVTMEGGYSPEGDFEHPQATFVMTVENNLGHRSPLIGPDGPVPPRSVKVSVDVTSGTVTRHLVTVLRPVPITHDSVSAGRNVNLDGTTGLVRVESRDAYINRLRAGEDLNLPIAENVRFLKHGMGVSFDELNVGGVDLATLSDDQVREAGETSGGVYVPNHGQTAPEIKPFDPSKISLPKTETDVPGGTWTFGEARKTQYIPHSLRYATPPDFPGGPPGHDETTRYQKKTSTYDKLESPNGKNYVAGVAIEGSTVLDPPNPPASEYGSEGAANSYGYSDNSDEGFEVPIEGEESDVHTLAEGFKVNVKTAQMVVLPSYRLKVPGNFIVVGLGARLPELYFGYNLTPGGVATQESLANGIEEAQNKPEEYMAAIVAGGDVNVTGGVIGYGSMLAGGELTIKASSGLRAAPDLGVVVKGRRIVINPSTEPEPSFPGEPVDADYPLFRSAIEAESGGDWAKYNSWLDHEQTQRDAIIESLRVQSTGSTANTLWATLCTQIETSIPAPNFASYGWPSGPITVDQYARLKEFLQTQASGYNGGDGDTTWLDLNKRTQDAAGRVAGVLNGVAQWARSHKQSFKTYLTNPDQGPPDMFFAGLMFAEEDLLVNSDDKSVKLEGAVMARTGSVTLTAPTKVDLVYNRTLIDDISANANSGPVQLEKVFVTID